jgi:hypothetical protein
LAILRFCNGRGPSGLVLDPVLDWCSWIGARGFPAGAIGDQLHSAAGSANFYLHLHPSTANLLLIVGSGVIDLLGLFLLLRWIFKRAARPFLGLVIVLGLRQITQALVSLPAPPNAIWHYPGFPSLLVTYGVANDYFFSGIRRSQSWLRRKSLAWADAGSPGWRCSSLSLRA